MFSKSPYLKAWFLYALAIMLLFLVLVPTGIENMTLSVFGIELRLKPVAFISLISLTPVTVLLILQSKKKKIVRPTITMLWASGGTFVIALIFLVYGISVFIADADLGTALFAPEAQQASGAGNIIGILGTILFAFAVPVTLSGLIAKSVGSSFKRGEET